MCATDSCHFNTLSLVIFVSYLMIIPVPFLIYLNTYCMLYNQKNLIKFHSKLICVNIHVVSQLWILLDGNTGT